ncbi:hypothetical protein [Streptomyces sp. NPDC058623]|uniref:hypothetical protein n=1 Tax=Streptomyces sp. NPDC058623 TaxID=3346563 RepID=UPI00364C7B90
MTTLGELFDVAVTELHETARTPLASALPADDGGPAGERIAAAARAVGAVRDTIGSHLGPERSPLTP